jgi:hypothetical protein
VSDERDIIERLLDFERCGRTSGTLVNLRECAAVEIARLRKELLDTESDCDRYRGALEVIAGSSQDKLQVMQAKAALPNIGGDLT